MSGYFLSPAVDIHVIAFFLCVSLDQAATFLFLFFS